MTNKLFAFIGLSGAGKTTIVKTLAASAYPGNLSIAVSHVTRSARHGEQDGVDNWFVSNEAFDAMKARGDFVEHIKTRDGQYGFTKEEFAVRLRLGRDVLFVATLEGAEEVDVEFGNVVKIWVDAPDFQRKRYMYHRGDSIDKINARINNDSSRLKEKKKCDYVIYNDALLSTVTSTAAAIIDAERHRRT